MVRLTYLLPLMLLALAASWLLPRVTQPPDRFSVALQLIGDGRAGEAVYLLDDPGWRGVAEYRAGRYRRALGALFEDETIVNLYNMGNAYARLHEWTGAQAAYRKVLRLDPNHADAQYNLDLVLAAEQAEKRLLEDSRDTRRLGQWRDGNVDDTTDPATESEGPTVDADLTDGTTTATAARPNSGGQSEAGGEIGEERRAERAGAGTAPGEGDPGTGELPQGRSGLARSRREESLSAEILLRGIADDPARVLRARLRQMHRNRQGGDGR